MGNKLTGDRGATWVSVHRDSTMQDSSKSAFISTGKGENVLIGSKAATLYLSSSSLKLHDKRCSSRESVVAGSPIGTGSKPQSPAQSELNADVKKPGTAPGRSTAYSRRSQDDESVSTEFSKLQPIREFTFTGYDIMADVEPEPKVEEVDVKPKGRLQAYLDSCNLLGITPVTYLSKQMSNKGLVMRSHSIGPLGARALAIALLNNDVITSLDLEDDGIEADGAKAIAEMLEVNSNIVDVNISENCIGTNGARAISKLMKTNQFIQSLDISGSNLVDSDAYLIADILQNNTTLRELILSHNGFCEQGGYILAQAIANNDTVRILDLSWNHLRGKGSLAITASLQKNIGLRKLDLAWNGFAKNDAIVLCKSLKENTTLKELDISHNRLDKEGIGYLMQGVKDSDGLEILRMGGNSITPELAIIILSCIAQSDSCRISLLDLGSSEVDEDFLSQLDDLQSTRSLNVVHGQVIKRENARGRKGDGIDGNLDAVYELYKYMHEHNYRVIDLMKWLDKDGDMSVSREEFKRGMMVAEVPLTEHQLDEMLDKLDMDGDGEVDFSELLIGERDFRRRMRRKQEREKAARKEKKKLQGIDKIILTSMSEKT
ncbi:leucine-rich repeat-containing protein 74A-like [Saccostrea echinata]|uniref:leucine-rich repeat-containing protein 74A-like n=1 Tax=Saccostrea echinata TaxID=191078 RepID=UPI002A812CFB|nr:leucine-rich repeat-containing protein 74A-like [Saccostrea echinata]